jgi:hypothetical protein
VAEVGLDEGVERMVACRTHPDRVQLPSVTRVPAMTAISDESSGSACEALWSARKQWKCVRALCGDPLMVTTAAVGPHAHAARQ